MLENTFAFDPPIEAIQKRKTRWKSISGYPGYEVSSTGDVLSRARLVSGIRNGKPYVRSVKETMLRQVTDRDGYRRVSLSVGGKTVQVCVQRLVAEAFLVKRNPLHDTVRHRDDNPSNNRSANLRWGTQAQNVEDKTRKDRQARGERIGGSVLNPTKVNKIRRLLRTGLSQREIGDLFGVTPENISCIKLGKTWTHVPDPSDARKIL